VPNHIDLNALGEGSKYALNVESETLEDAAARRQEEAEEARHRRRIQFWTIMLTIVLVLFAVFVCGDVILTGVPDDKKVA
jgi:Tfp pilus assembly protein PilN